MANHYEVPSWAGKPPTGLHFDVMKDDKLIQKLMVDEKKCYLFGRNSQLNDFVTDHASCSRVHAAFVYHKFLNIAYLVDLGSTHGTFIGSVRLEAHKPTQVHVGANFHFGASTRNYILRERPSGNRMGIIEDIPMSDVVGEGALLGLPESQSEIDNLTEFNTAHNRRISMLGIPDDANFKKNKNKRKKKNVTFNEEEIVINPEDIDPTVGRFRNLIQSVVVQPSAKRPKLESNSPAEPKTFISPQPYSVPSLSLYQGINEPVHDKSAKVETDVLNPFGAFGSKFTILPNPAPEVSSEIIGPSQSKNVSKDESSRAESSDEPKKKKYAKEAWPGRKPLMGV